MLVCTVSDHKRFPSGKSFTNYFKVGMFGKTIDQLCPQLQPGTLVCVVGDASLDFGKESDPSSKPALKVTGQISVLDEAKEQQAQTPPKPKQQAQPKTNEDDSDQPF